MFGGTPDIITQLFSIHIIAYGVTHAESYGALPRKTKVIYIRYLRVLKGFAEELEVCRKSGLLLIYLVMGSGSKNSVRVTIMLDFFGGFSNQNSYWVGD